MTVVLAKDFTDLDNSHWAYSYVSDLTEQGVINGYEDGTYRPNGTVTRAEYIKLLVCTDENILISGEKLIEENEIELKKWYDKYVYTANLMGLNPYLFESGDLEKPINRAEMAGILDEFAKFEGLIEFKYTSLTEEQENQVKELMAKYAMELGYTKKKNVTKDNFDKDVYPELDSFQFEEIMKKVNEELDISSWGENQEFIPLFDDTAELNVYDIVSINHMKVLGIVRGYEDGSFRPFNDITRAEIAVVISNYLKLLNGGTL